MKKKKELSLEFFQEQGRIGGKVGGAKAWEGLTPEERSARARAAVAKRKWHAVKPPDPPKPGATKKKSPAKKKK
ncbi:hypothetical protein [Nevskia soli]|uniref:hypothetical protein n=1 Tax=Nevskia soli TaxID=418856 RepID=UPI0015D96368|nr:hypothetical protein [Nevskia soli]